MDLLQKGPNQPKISIQIIFRGQPVIFFSWKSELRISHCSLFKNDFVYKCFEDLFYME